MRRTLHDWLTHARAATSATEVDHALHEAAEQAASCSDWRTILGALAEHHLAERERLAGAANRALEAAVTETAVWGFNDVARVRAKLLGDEAGARAAMQAGMQRFTERPVAPYEWALLARGFAEALDDAAGIQRCLDAGRDLARAQRSVDGLCSVAMAAAKLADRGAAITLAAEAEALAAGAVQPAWTIANTWRALGDLAAAARVLAAARARAATAKEALHVAQACASHGDEGGVGRALASAEGLARTAAEWLEVAELSFDVHHEPTLRRALDRAAALASDDAQRGQIAAGYHRWLHDDDAANRLGPRGVRPEALRKPARRLDGWQSSASGLLDWLRPRMTREHLEGIADADYGSGAEKNLAALLDICATGLVPRSLDWHPREVLELTRWGSGEQVNHLVRAFCCTLLYLSTHDDVHECTAPILVESSVALGPEARALAEQLFVWRCETNCPDDEDDEDEGAEPAALLLLVILAAAADSDDPRLEALVAMLVEHPWGTSRHLIDLMEGSIRAELWADLRTHILVPARAGHPAIETLLGWLGPRER